VTDPPALSPQKGKKDRKKRRSVVAEGLDLTEIETEIAAKAPVLDELATEIMPPVHRFRVQLFEALS